MTKKQSNPLPEGATGPPPPPPPMLPTSTAYRVESVLDDMVAEYCIEQTLVTETLETMRGNEYCKRYRQLECKQKKLIAGFNALLDLKARLIKAEIL